LTTLGIDLAVRAAHVATLTDERGKVVWASDGSATAATT